MTALKVFDAAELTRARAIIDGLGPAFDWFEARQQAEAQGVSQRALRAVLRSRTCGTCADNRTLSKGSGVAQD